MDQQAQSNIAKDLLPILLSLLKQAKAPNTVNIKKHCHYLFDTTEYVQEKHLKPNRHLRPFEERFNEKFEALKATKVMDLLNENQEELATALQHFRFRMGRNPGERMIPILGLKELVIVDGQTEQRDAEYRYEEGAVNCILLWNSNDEDTFWLAQEFTRITRKYEQTWGDQFKLVLIAVDDTLDNVVDKIEAFQLDGATHYLLDSPQQDNVSFQLLKQNGFKLPSIILIDKYNQITFIGRKKFYDLESSVKHLINQEFKDSKFQQEVDPAKLADYQIGYKRNKQFLKEDWKKFLEENKIRKFSKYFELKLGKKVTYDNDGNKKRYQYKKLKVSYKIRSNYQAKARLGISLIRKTLANDAFHFKKERFTDSKQDFGDNINFLKKLAETYHIDLELALSKVKFVKVVDGKFDQNKDSWIYQVGRVDPSLAQYAFSIQQQTNDYLAQNKEHDIERFQRLLHNGLNFALREGDDFIPIQNLHKLNDDFESLTVDYSSNRITVINFWEPHSEVSISSIHKVVEQLKDHHADQKVRIVAISVEAHGAQKILDENPSWKEGVEFFVLKDKVQNPAHYLYALEKLPHFIVVGYNGVIEQIGDVYDVAQLVDDIISVEEGQLREHQDSHQNLSLQATHDVEAFLSDKSNFAQLIDHAKYLNHNIFYFEVGINIVKSINLDTYEKSLWKTNKLYVKYWVREEHKIIIDQVLEKLFKILPEGYFHIEGSVSKSFDIPFPGDDCYTCSNPLDENTPQYFNFFNKKFYCTQCAESFDPSKRNEERYKVQDNVVFINAPIHDRDQTFLQEVDEEVFGQNLKVPEGVKGDQFGPLVCIGCEAPSKGPRYIAMGPQYPVHKGSGDKQAPQMCQRCFERYRKGELKLKENPSTPWIRVLFYHPGYKY